MNKLKFIILTFWLIKRRASSRRSDDKFEIIYSFTCIFMPKKLLILIWQMDANFTVETILDIANTVFRRF